MTFELIEMIDFQFHDREKLLSDIVTNSQSSADLKLDHDESCWRGVIHY